MSATWSQALPSISSAPSTDCSASTECGGTSPSAPVPPPSRRERSGVLTSGPAASACFFGDDDDWKFQVDVGVQVQMDRVLAYGPQRTTRQTHFTSHQRVASSRRRFRDVRRADRPEQLAFAARLGGDRELEFLQPLGTLLC